jgi:RNA polymerase sigma-70 factor (ECF subfamily)
MNQKKVQAIEDERSSVLLDRWRQGDMEAAAELFRRYANRLIGLARRRVPAKLMYRVDPEDVVQSVYRSFFSAAREGRYDLQRGGDLWRLLVTITLNKLYHQVKRNQRAKRAADRECSLEAIAGSAGVPASLLSQEPSPEEAAALADELEQLFRSLDALDRRIVELRLQGYQLDEIAAQTDRSERTVRRVLEEVKGQLERWHGDSSAP